MSQKTPAYSVKMVNATALSAAELRFRMALEFAVDGQDHVLPTLQACMLALYVGHQPGS